MRRGTLAYVDDLVLLAKSEEGMKEMMSRTERYLRRKCLSLYTEKSKIVCFRKRRKEESQRNGGGGRP